MSLQNLLGISLEQITPQKETVRRLIDGAARHIADAKVKAISPETRFSSAYTAIRMLADVGLHAHGCRTLTSKPGHHQTAIQTLPKTLEVDSQTVIRLDKLRKQRNLTEYTGDIRLEIWDRGLPRDEVYLLRWARGPLTCVRATRRER
jgi:hypothetical protein